MVTEVTFILLCTLLSFSNGTFFRKYLGMSDIFHSRSLQPVTDGSVYTGYYFLQKLDHFSPTHNGTWAQRYFVESKFYKKDGPAYLMINGEWTASAHSLYSGYWTSHGQANNAILFSLEHRYYGSSQPTSDTSTENLRYLTTQQALFDTAHFIQKMNKMYNLPDNIKWIVFGGSYAGSLAAWLRLKYPHLVHGAVASSAPLLAKLDFHEYFEVVRESLSSYDEECPKQIKKAHRRLDTMVKTKHGREQITKKFRLCSSLSNKTEDISTFFTSASDIIAYIVQYNKEVPNSQARISETCNIMLDNSTKIAVNKYAKAILQKLGGYCLNANYDDSIAYMKKSDWETSASSLRAWYYQTCTEYGYYATSSKITDTFGKNFPVKFFMKMCSDVFGKRFDDMLLNNAVHRTNTFFGELKINMKNLIHVHGSTDPWHALGIFNVEKRKQHKVIYIKDASHCEDMRSPSSYDSEGLQKARAKILKILDLWLRQSKET